MKRKFSTLLASALLMTAFSANAQEVGDNVMIRYQGTGVIAVDNAESAFGTPKMIEDSELTTPDLKTLNQSTWNITEVTTSLGKVSYSFVNKATGLALAVDPSLAVDASETSGPALTLGGSASVWTLDGNDSDNLKLVSYFKGDSVVYIQKDASNNLYLVKDAATKANKSLMAVYTSVLEKQTSIELDAEDLNTLLQSARVADFFGLTMEISLRKTYAIGFP